MTIVPEGPAGRVLPAHSPRLQGAGPGWRAKRAVMCPAWSDGAGTKGLLSGCMSSPGPAASPAPPPAHSTQAHCSTSVHVFVTVFKIQQATEFTLEGAQPQLLSQCDSPSWIRFSVFFQLSNPWGPFYSLHQPPSSLVATDGQGNCHRHVIVGAHIRWDPEASRSYSLWPQILDL